jgi:hypothetical protein
VSPCIHGGLMNVVNVPFAFRTIAWPRCPFLTHDLNDRQTAGRRHEDGMLTEGPGWFVERRTGRMVPNRVRRRNADRLEDLV